MSENNAVAVVEKSVSERFMLKVVEDFGSGVGEVALTNFQKRLAQNYFMSIDAALAKNEEARLKKSGKYQDQTPSTWQNVNMVKLSRDVVACARIGLDPMEKNHINPVLYKNNSAGKYDVGFIIGYRGQEMKAKKYGLDVPDNIIVELVYSKDKFKAIKKSRANKVEDFEFEVVDPFDRGEIIGGFYYHEYLTNMAKNKLVTLSIKDIEKRKPKYASPEFWGGEKDVWENGKKVGKEQVEGWRDKMCYKTVYRAAYADITIDSQKIDNDYMMLSAAENAAGSVEFNAEYAENANSTMLPMSEPIDQPAEIAGETINQETGEIVGGDVGGEPVQGGPEPSFAV